MNALIRLNAHFFGGANRAELILVDHSAGAYYTLDDLNKKLADLAAPIPMLLFCPRCQAQHIDRPTPGWTNPPHATHTCLSCGLLWRPSNRNTVGVGSLEVSEYKHVQRARNAYPGEHATPHATDLPICASHADSWYCGRNHLAGDHDCVVCAHVGTKK